MKKYIYIIISLLFILFLGGCGKKLELSKEEFKLLLSNKNFVVYDDTSNEILSDTNVLSFTSASSSDIGMGFIELKNESAAKYLFSDYKTNEEGKDKSIEKHTNLFNYNKYSYENADEYYSLIRVGKTILIVNSDISKKEEVISIIDQFGY